MSLKFASPLLGYNNNLRHKGRVFHIQTEDSGAKYGHIITHLFMDGGRILKSVKSNYSEYLGSDRIAEIVRDLMKQQHRAMAIALRDGTFDSVVEGDASVSQEMVAISATAVNSPASGPPRASSPVESQASLAYPPSPHPAAPDARRRKRASFPAGMLEGSGIAPFDVPRVQGGESGGELAKRVEPEPSAQGNPGFSLGNHSPLRSDISALGSIPAPPANGPSAFAPSVTSAAPRPAGTARPASVFGQARPKGQSIFGEDLLSDKSLDEVILSYLAAELEKK